MDEERRCDNGLPEGAGDTGDADLSAGDTRAWLVLVANKQGIAQQGHLQLTRRYYGTVER